MESELWGLLPFCLTPLSQTFPSTGLQWHYLSIFMRFWVVPLGTRKNFLFSTLQSWATPWDFKKCVKLDAHQSSTFSNVQQREIIKEHEIMLVKPGLKPGSAAFIKRGWKATSQDMSEIREQIEALGVYKSVFIISGGGKVFRKRHLSTFRGFGVSPMWE